MRFMMVVLLWIRCDVVVMGKNKSGEKQRIRTNDFSLK
jgi:hypothetical protein